MCGESWLATKDLQPTTPVLKAGHPVSYSVVCLCVSWDGGFLGFFLLLSLCFASVLYTCTYAHVHVYYNTHTIMYGLLPMYNVLV